MKNVFVLLAIICIYSAEMDAQNTSNLYIGLNTGAGASIRQIKTNISLIPGQDKASTTIYGYAIPLTLPIMYGQKQVEGRHYCRI